MDIFTQQYTSGAPLPGRMPTAQPMFHVLMLWLVVHVYRCCTCVLVCGAGVCLCCDPMVGSLHLLITGEADAVNEHGHVVEFKTKPAVFREARAIQTWVQCTITGVKVRPHTQTLDRVEVAHTHIDISAHNNREKWETGACPRRTPRCGSQAGVMLHDA